MSTQTELLDHNMARLTIEVPAEELDKAMQNSYNKQKKSFNVPGFRKGKVPRKMIEQMYGPGIFYEDAANELVPKAYSDAYDETDLEIVSQPDFNIVQIEEGKPFIFTAEVAVKPEVTLGEYKGLPVDRYSTDVSDEEVDAKIKEEAEKNARTVTVEDRPVQEGDDLVLDFDGSIDGVPFDGGKAQNYPLTVGSHAFIPGFEEQLVGKNPEEDFDITVTFPEDYQAEDLAGKEAVFKCRIHEIKTKEYPDIDDEFASEVSEFDTLDEYKEDVRNKLKEEKETEGKQNQEDQAVDEAVANIEVDIPDAMIQAQTDQMVDEFARQLQSQGMTLDLYLQYVGMDRDQLEEQMKPQAVDRIKGRLTLEAIAAAEGIVCSDERLDEEIKKMAEQYSMEPDQLKEMLGDYELDEMKRDIAVQDAITFLVDNAVEIDPSEREKEETDKEPEDTAQEPEDEADAPAGESAEEPEETEPADEPAEDASEGNEN